MRLRLTFVLLAAGPGISLPVSSPAAVAQRAPAQPDPAYVWLSSGSQEQDQNFYLLTLLTQVPEYRDAIARSRAFSRIRASRSRRVASLLAKCRPEDGECHVRAMLWQPDEIESVGEALVADPAIADIASRHLRPSGAFDRYAAKSDAALVRAAWEDAAAAMNRIDRVYGLGDAPRYPKIDSWDFKPGDARFARLTVEALDKVALGTPKDAPVFAPPLQFALTLLYLNERELVRHSALLEARENGPAAAQVAGTNWSRYPYVAILVLGDGPAVMGKEVGDFGKLRTMRAAQLYREGKAPFIIASGGAVHPAHTNVFEAMSMKRELVERYGIPANAVLIDPAARHTTTNFRNSARLMFRLGLPMDRPSIVTSSAGHITSIVADTFRQRFDEELGYQPIVRGRQLGPYEMEFRPRLMSLQRDAMDPLDP